MIYIDKAVTTAGGVAASHHQVVKAELSTDGVAMNVQGMSWSSGLQRVEGQPPLERWAVRIELAALVGNASGLLGAVADYLVASSPLAGGTVIPPEARTLDEAKQLKWAEIKRGRDAVEYGGFDWDGSHFDSDETSRSRIQGAVQLARIAQSFGQLYSIDWTLSDNSERTLSGDDMVSVGVALGTHVGAAFETARVLRAQIDAATTTEEVDAVAWPA